MRRAVLAITSVLTACAQNGPARATRPASDAVSPTTGERKQESRIKSSCASRRTLSTAAGLIELCSISSAGGGDARVSGIVVDREGRPIFGARLVLRSLTASGAASSGGSDRQGRIELSAPPGKYGVFVLYGRTRLCLPLVIRAGAVVMLRAELTVERSVHLLRWNTEGEEGAHSRGAGRGRHATVSCP
jgi:hypothetical protein